MRIRHSFSGCLINLLCKGRTVDAIRDGASSQNETGTQIFVTVADGCPYRTVGRSIVDVYSSQGNIFRIHIAGHRNAVGLFIVMQINRNPGELLVLHISGLIVDPAHIDNDSAALFQRTIGSVFKIRLLVNVGPAGVGLVPGNDLIASFRILQRCRHVQFCRAGSQRQQHEYTHQHQYQQNSLFLSFHKKSLHIIK